MVFCTDVLSTYNFACLFFRHAFLKVVGKKKGRKMEEELLAKIENEIKRLQTEDIAPATENAHNQNSTRIAEMAKRFSDYKKILENAHDNKDINIVINYANEIFNKINWNSSEVKDTDNRIDTLKILVYILNVVTTDKQKTNYLEIEHSIDNGEKIINIISTRLCQ